VPASDGLATPESLDPPMHPRPQPIELARRDDDQRLANQRHASAGDRLESRRGIPQ
jgi:hypothetical protein